MTIEDRKFSSAACFLKRNAYVYSLLTTNQVTMHDKGTSYCTMTIYSHLPQLQCTGNRKHQSLQFSLPLDDSHNVRVCKKMFLRTLNITERLITYTMKKAATGFSCADERGKHEPHNKTPERLLNRVRQHIESFPTMAPHYCRSDTNRRFLGSDLNI